MKKFLLLIAVYCFVTCAHSLAQNPEQKKFDKDKIIPAPAQRKDTIISIPTPPTTPTPSPAASQESEGAVDIGEFNPFKAPSIVSRDTFARGLDEIRVVKVSEELKIDCTWVKSAEYYSVWDSKNLNPYNRNAALFRDTLTLKLYNSPLGELWAAPLEVTLQTSTFGPRWGSFHHGIDLNLKTGDPVYTVFDGIVRISGWSGNGYGNYVVMRHKNGLETLYGHLSECKVKPGQVLKAGQIIGLGGSTGWSTGPHLHFEVRYAGNTFNPLLMYDFSKPQVLLSDTLTLMPQHFSHLGNKFRQKITHTVTAGETLGSISAKYKVPVFIIARQNHLNMNAVLQVGQTLVIF